MATEICPNEGKDWIANNVIAGATVYAFLLYGITIAGSGITAITDLSTIQSTAEETGTGYARQSFSMGASTDGIMAMPTFSWSTGSATNWHTNCQAIGIATHVTAGVALYYWDLSTTRNMHAASTTLTIPTLDFFFLNPGE